MALFGSGFRKPGGIVPTPEQQEETRRLEAQFGLSPDTQQAIDTYAAMPRQAPEESPQGFWQGGDKFRGRDALAGILAAVGDALTQQSGGRPYAMKGLLGGRTHAMELAEAAQKAQQQRLADWQDWKQRKDYEWQNKPETPSAIQQNYGFIGEQLGPEAANSYLSNYGDPIVTVPLGNGQVYNGPRSGLARAMGGGQTIGSSLPQGWKLDEGGPASAPGGFRR